jgi:flagellar hook protein FlgE
MTSAFNAGLSGLRANSTAVETVGHNLANVNTPGFKTSTTNFRDLLSPYPGAAGLGAGQPLVTRQFAQGNIQGSAGVLDAAISGDGFFVFRTGDSRQVYSRAGSFQVDAAGRLTAPGGEPVQGWSAVSGAVNANGPIGDILMPSGALRPAIATTALTLDFNLNAAAATGQLNGTFTTGAQVFDSLGQPHTITFTFTKTADNTWSYTATMPASDFGSGDEPQEVANGSLTFDGSGLLTSPAADEDPISITATGLAGGAADLDIEWSLFAPDGTPRATQMALTSALADASQNGSAAAQLLGVSMGDAGRILARLSTGEEITVGQLALAGFRNPSSLESIGGNFFAVGSLTSEPAIGLPESGGRGRIVANSLEGSTVDMAQEFTNLIVYQRGYQASSRVITTADELVQETMSIKR